MPHKPGSATLADLRAVVGSGGWLDSAQDVDPYTHDFRRLYRGSTPLVLLPRDVAEVAQVLRICDRDAVALVPQGGNTSYCGAATPDESGSQIVLSMRRLNRIRHIDADNFSMVVEAGCTLAEAQAAAHAANRLFPLSLGSEGSAQIGGNLATNAGGTAVLRYGMMRDLVLGLEVVLADGRILSALKALRKDNTGYDVKSLFIGAEGTLGVITAACLKLFPQPADVATALIAMESPQHALELLVRLRGSAGDQVTSFELLPRRAVELTVQYVEGVANMCWPSSARRIRIRIWPRCWPSNWRRRPRQARFATHWSRRPGRRPRRCGSCANRCRRRSAAMARASSTTCRYRFRRCRASSRKAAAWSSGSRPRAR
jgi:FAD/FMN-containing dehydrogenase